MNCKFKIRISLLELGKRGISDGYDGYVAVLISYNGIGEFYKNAKHDFL